ncbi:aldehyde dehydrogenase family protein [Actinocorallia sp. A-T 12471]|uniref:aldehyde dehydrogenase family protein n=1 Tax=Actinocorallia sp. A-T 12471 TaxID=3089813 RepID=UPI0029CDCDAE|nr:aldehyde dehydrogenase family protein [Actinocorallia sp. A-T 12471]MDX6744176.1 aldehyde dehydrogenase family protein [Actinocorallia sp. A-T 12471]
MSDQPRVKHWIDGEWTSSPTEKNSVNPATGEVIGTYSDGDAGTADLAIEAAARAFATSGWRHDAMGRATALSRLADAFETRLGDLVQSLGTENGKLNNEAGYEVHFIPRALRFASGLALLNQGRVAETKPGVQSLSIRQPVGVAGIIVPWNSPAYLSIRAIAPALAAGCTVAVKMPAQAAQTGAIVAEIFASVPDFPQGVVNFFVESGDAGARRLVESPSVPVISFTGSTGTGRAIARAAADGLKRVSLELGGKTPHLVFEDADLAAVVPTIVASTTVFAGQFCMTGSRILAHSSIADELIEAVAKQLESVRPGPAADPESQIGPMIDLAAVARVDAAVEEAIAAGAVPIVRGGPSTLPHLKGGAFYHPTLLEVSSTDLPIVQTETFGPVQTVQRFDTEEEAIALANATEYGLSACVWSRDSDRPMRVARALEAGLISINSWANLAVEFEEGGFKSSGLGRLGGVASLDDFLEYKQISQAYA